MCLNRLIEQRGERWTCEARFQSEWAIATLNGQQVLLAKPQTYMNQSGMAVLPLARHFSCRPDELLVVFDDFSLAFGRLRFRRGGSDGGHNGLASVLETLGTEQIPRLRLGIGQPPPKSSVIDYVLSPFAPDQQVALLIERSVEAAVYWVEAGIEAAMNRFNSMAVEGC